VQQARQRRSPAAIDPLRIVVVDDHRFMRELISAMLVRQGGATKSSPNMATPALPSAHVKN